MEEREFVNHFIDDLVNKYGYPKESIKTEVKIGNNIFDVAIQKGIVYIQVFEFKDKLAHEVRNVYQRFCDVSVETPFYCVVFDSGKKCKIYDGSNLEKEVQDIVGVLSYNNAIAKFFRPTLNDFEAVKNTISGNCQRFAGVIFTYLLIHILSEICPCIDMHIPLSPELITFAGLGIILSFLPSFIKLWNYIKRIKIGVFELDLREELYNG